MICTMCREKLHALCVQYRADPENPLMTGYIEKTWCDCAHQPGTVLRPDRKPDPRRGG